MTDGSVDGRVNPRIESGGGHDEENKRIEFYPLFNLFAASIAK
jgi:hypothetical protein